MGLRGGRFSLALHMELSFNCPASLHTSQLAICLPRKRQSAARQLPGCSVEGDKYLFEQQDKGYGDLDRPMPSYGDVPGHEVCRDAYPPLK